MQVTRPRPEEHLSFSFERNIVVWSQGPLAGGRSIENSGKVAFEKNLYHATGLAAGPFEKELADRRSRGLDQTSIVADPLFVDPKNGNYQLRAESPAAKIGFVPFDPTKAGIQAP